MFPLFFPNQYIHMLHNLDTIVNESNNNGKFSHHNQKKLKFVWAIEFKTLHLAEIGAKKKKRTHR